MMILDFLSEGFSLGGWAVRLVAAIRYDHTKVCFTFYHGTRDLERYGMAWKYGSTEWFDVCMYNIV